MQDRSTWGPVITKLVAEEDISLVPFKVTVDYDFWSATEILWSILPETTHEELPHSFNQAGHIGRLQCSMEFRFTLNISSSSEFA